jgi:glutathione S-transferase
VAPELLQFPYSHYNEKARWAFDYKRVPHVRRNLLPGPHAVAIKRLTGETQLPVVRFGSSLVAGSARIIDELEKQHPDPALYPAEPELRRRALEIQAWLDEEIGPRVRCALFSSLLEESAFIGKMFASDRNLLTRALFRASYPLIRGTIRKGMGITDRASIERGYDRTREGLDFVASTAGPSGHLVGDCFTVADLTAAALLAPAAGPPNSPMSLPEPRPPCLREWLAHWADHPGVAWVRKTYRAHRPDSAEIA